MILIMAKLEQFLFMKPFSSFFMERSLTMSSTLVFIQILMEILSNDLILTPISVTLSFTLLKPTFYQTFPF
jgi:hypothetical protein